MRKELTIDVPKGSKVDPHDNSWYSEETIPESKQDEIDLLKERIMDIKRDAWDNIRDIVSYVEQKTGQPFVKMEAGWKLQKPEEVQVNFLTPKVDAFAQGEEFSTKDNLKTKMLAIALWAGKRCLNFDDWQAVIDWMDRIDLADRFNEGRAANYHDKRAPDVTVDRNSTLKNQMADIAHTVGKYWTFENWQHFTRWLESSPEFTRRFLDGKTERG